MDHEPVLCEEILKFFHEKKIKVFWDATLGAGGHAKLLLENHPEIELFLGSDQDPIALGLAKEKLSDWKEKVQYIQKNFSQMTFKKKLDGCLFDLGISSMQLAEGERGFSFQKEGFLDMRMNPEASMTAAEVLRTSSEEKLGEIFRELGEEKRWRAVARAIVRARKQKPIQTTQDLLKVILPSLKKRGKIHPATLVFQGLRIFVNHELDVLKLGLESAKKALSDGGRMAVISFHSGEDRIVKWFFKNSPELEILTKKPLVATREEQRKNPRSRSAKLRVAEKRQALHE